ncbi:MAG TPA: cytochrome o ubiquinol oxidase subunit IV [Acetobacteraceae bacterium]|jgi:cytochrome o ubiquinol oxidase subunit IV|nr:cytochrome o ubiquinol oxidase subunit IV [Acetobacteraceae bacterium]
MSDAHQHRDPQYGDAGPGYMEGAGQSIRESIQTYVLGLVLAALLTAAAFYIEGTKLIWGPGIPVALIVLAVAQIGVHLVFFLHITSAPDNTNNILALAFGVLIVALIFGGSVWIMAHLTDNLMPMRAMMPMQR